MRSILLRLPLLSLILVLAGPTQSLDFSNDLVLYYEDFEGETSFPTTPEVDLIEAGGMFGISYTAIGTSVPTLSGTAVSASVSSDSYGDSLEEVIVTESLGTDSFNLRGEYSGLSASLDAIAELHLDATLRDIVEQTIGDIGLRLIIDSVGGFAVLRVVERDGTLPAHELNNFLDVLVPPLAYDALLAGAAFVLDCQIDRAAETVTASIDIDGFSPTIVGPMSFTVVPQTKPLEWARTTLELSVFPFPVIEVEVEIDSFRISRTQAAVMVPALSSVSLALLAAALLGAAWHLSHNRSYDTHGTTTSSA